MMVEDASGAKFVSNGIRSITFNSDGTYTSDIFTNGSGNITGSYILLGLAVAVTSPNPPDYPPFVAQLGAIVVTPTSLNFVLNMRPVGGAFGSVHTVYLLSRV
jgi:hypothetical protein